MSKNLHLRHFQRDTSVLSDYVRAIGDTGDLNRMLSALERLLPILERDRAALYRCALTVFALCGERNHVTRLLQGPFRDLRQSHRQLWLAASELASGNALDAQQQFQELLASDDAVVRRVAARRLEYPL